MVLMQSTAQMGKRRASQWGAGSRAPAGGADVGAQRTDTEEKAAQKEKHCSQDSEGQIGNLKQNDEKALTQFLQGVRASYVSSFPWVDLGHRILDF